MFGLKVARFSFLALIFSLPLIFLPWTYLSFELPKILLLYLFSGLILIGFFIGNFTFKKLNISAYALIFLLFWIFFTGIVGASFSQSFFGSYFRSQGILTFICYIVLFFASGFFLQNKLFKKELAWCVLIGSMFVSILAIIQFISFWVFGNTGQLLYSNRIIATFGQPNFLGAYLVMALPFIWYLKGLTKGQKGLIFWFPVICVLITIILTFSRSAWLGLILLLVVWGIGNIKKSLIAAILLALFTTAIFVLLPDLSAEQWQRLQTDLSKKWTAENRSLIAGKAIEVIEYRPLIGWGVSNFNLSFPTVLSEEDLGLKDLTVDSAHNLFLDLTVEIGLIGLAVFLVFIGLIIKSGLKSMHIEKEDIAFKNICLINVVVFLLMHQFSIVSVVPGTLLWVCLGILSGVLIHQKSVQTSKFKLFISGLMVEMMIVFVIQTLRADILFKKSIDYEVPDTKKAIELDNQAIKIAPWVKHYQWRRDYLKDQLGK